MKKVNSMHVTEESTHNGQNSESPTPKEEMMGEFVTSSIEDQEELVPHLHAKTFLTVFAVCLIYFAQLINLVGAGAVSLLQEPFLVEFI